MKWQNPMLPNRTSFWRYFLVVGVLALAYFGTAELAFLTLDLGVEASPLWPPAGIALAALLLQGRRVWPGIALGAFFFAVSLEVSWLAAGGIAFGSALQPLVGAELLRRMRFSPSLQRVQDVLQLLVLGAWVSPLVNATISTMVGYLSGSVVPNELGKNWWVLWLGDGMGVLVVTPLVLVLNHAILALRLPKAAQQPMLALNLEWGLLEKPQNLKEPRSVVAIQHSTSQTPNRAEVVVCFTLLCTISWFVFGSKTANGIAQYPLEYLPLPIVAWAALRFAQLGGVMASLVVSIIAIGGAVQGVGPFVAKTGEIDLAIQFLLCFMGVVTIVALVLAAAESERTFVIDLLKEREASLANAQRLAKLGNWDFYETYPGRSEPEYQLRWSDELYRIFGFAAGAFEPSWEAFFKVVHPEDRERVAKAIRGALREHKAYCLDYRIVRSDGSERVVCERSEINKSGISGTVQDITDRKQVEAQLRAAAEHMRESAEKQRLLGEMALRIRRSLNLDQILNTTVAEVRQFLEADRVFIGQIDQLGQESLAQHSCSQVGQMLAKRDFSQVGRWKQELNVENLTSTKEQASTPIQGLVIAESVDPCYPSLRSMIVDDEVTLNEWRSLFSQGRAIVIEDTSAVAKGDAGDTMAFSSNIVAYHCEYQVKAILGVPIWVGNELYGALVVNQCDQPRQWQSWEIEWLTSLATQVAIAIQQAELYRQITQLNTHLESQVEERTHELSTKMTELQELNHLKDVFLQAVSHDLRTSILGMSMLLNNLCKSSGDTVSISRPLLERITTSNERQLNLINSLLEDHFQEKRQLELQRQPIHIDHLIQGLIADYSPMLAQNKAILTSSFPENCPLIPADPTQLRRVLENLLTNAVKHNPPGLNITLQITIEDKMMRCTLQDDGVGMSQQQQNSLFKLYIRGLHTQHLTGIGLGLYQCRQIITAHGGQIDVKSTPGTGSTFWFTLPVPASTELEATEPNSSQLSSWIKSS